MTKIKYFFLSVVFGLLINTSFYTTTSQPLSWHRRATTYVAGSRPAQYAKKYWAGITGVGITGLILTFLVRHGFYSQNKIANLAAATAILAAGGASAQALKDWIIAHPNASDSDVIIATANISSNENKQSPLDYGGSDHDKATLNNQIQIQFHALQTELAHNKNNVTKTMYIKINNDQIFVLSLTADPLFVLNRVNFAVNIQQKNSSEKTNIIDMRNIILTSSTLLQTIQKAVISKLDKKIQKAKQQTEKEEEKKIKEETSATESDSSKASQLALDISEQFATNNKNNPIQWNEEERNENLKKAINIHLVAIKTVSSLQKNWTTIARKVYINDEKNNQYTLVITGKPHEKTHLTEKELKSQPTKNTVELLVQLKKGDKIRLDKIYKQDNLTFDDQATSTITDTILRNLRNKIEPEEEEEETKKTG